MNVFVFGRIRMRVYLGVCQSLQIAVPISEQIFIFFQKILDKCTLAHYYRW